MVPPNVRRAAPPAKEERKPSLWEPVPAHYVHRLRTLQKQIGNFPQGSQGAKDSAREFSVLVAEVVRVIYGVRLKGDCEDCGEFRGNFAEVKRPGTGGRAA